MEPRPLEKKSDRKIFYKNLVDLTELDAKSTDIIIEYRNLIEYNRKIEKMDENKNPTLERGVFETSNLDLENKIEEIISENSIFKKRVEKTFLDSQRYNREIVLPMIIKYGHLKVIKALKKNRRGVFT